MPYYLQTDGDVDNFLLNYSSWSSKPVEYYGKSSKKLLVNTKCVSWKKLYRNSQTIRGKLLFSKHYVDFVCDVKQEKASYLNVLFFFFYLI